MIFNVGNPKDSTRKLLDIMQQFNNVIGYKINEQKEVTFLYINNVTEESEIQESIPFTIAPKTIRYVGINLTKEVEDLYSENYKTLMKEIEDDVKKWKDIPCSWNTGRTSIIKMSILPKAIYIFMQSLSKHQQHFTELEQTILKFLWNHKRSQLVKATFKKKS